MAQAGAADGATYPDLQGQWSRIRATGWDPDKPWGRRQQAPLTPEYQAIFEANLAEQAAGAPGDSPSWYCMPYGMPQMMMGYEPMEFVVTPAATYVLTSHNNDAFRRIFTTGATGRGLSSRASRAIRSEPGSTRTATAVTTCSPSRPATSRDRAPTTPAAFRVPSLREGPGMTG
jgi:hypothetical protein